MLSPEEKRQLQDAMTAVRLRASQALGQANGAAQAVAFVGTLHGNLDAVITASEAAGPPPDCKPGCASCCHARVEVSDPEALHIGACLRQLPEPEQQALIGRLRAKARDEGASLRQRLPCAFLRDGLCSIYAIRPAVCRKAHSLSAQACQSGADDIPQDLNRVIRCEVLMAGTREAYDSVGLPASRHELSAAVLAALDREALADWHRGKPLLETPQP
ncbi:hypothetical protein BRI6_3724 [plant metagenome]|uniref:Uncharacterized protein n=1 Tax=plant metagenome TaxID=1297885 RepID=A0A484QXA5_9ZZZZ